MGVRNSIYNTGINMDYTFTEKQVTASGKWQVRVIISNDESIFLKFNDEPSQVEINREAESYVLRKRLAEIRDEPLPDTQPEALVSKLTKLQYMNRFRDDELANIYAAAKVSPAVEVWLEKFKLSDESSLNIGISYIGYFSEKEMSKPK